ncbi:MAG: hypothetical protein AAGC46_12495 [Solirubrobacteraceae bacterium]|nr:hypothetical protein [Patulibacter sp.]
MRASVRSLVLTLAVGAAALAPPSASAALARTVIDGPTANLATGTTAVEVDAAPDGTAAIAYLKQVAGVTHVFVSRYVGGTWSSAEQVDGGLSNQANPSSLPALAVGNGGRVVVAFANGPALQESLWAVVKPSAGSAYGPPQQIKAFAGTAWTDPNLELASNGNGYLTFYNGGTSLYADQVTGSTFTQVGPGILNQDPGRQALPGDQTGVRIGVDPTGTSGTIAWAEQQAVMGTTVWARKLTGTTPGAAVDATVPSFNGHLNDNSQNNDIDVAIGGGKTWVAQHVSFEYPGGSSRARVFARTFDGSTFGPAQEIDGIGEADDNAELVRLAVNDAGQGLAVSYRGKNVDIGSETSILSGSTWGAAAPIARPNVASAARPTAAVDTTGVGAAATYSVASTGATPQVVSRIYGGPADGTLTTLSDPAFGDASDPYESGAGGGKFVSAFFQGTGATSRVVAAVLDLPVPPVVTPAPVPPVPTQPPPPCAVSAVACPTGFSIGLLTLRSKSVTRGTAAPSIVSATSAKRTLSFSLPRAASVTLTLSKVSTGRRSGSKCVAQTAKNRKAKSCTRLTPVKGSAAIAAPAGVTNLAFQGSLSRGKLAAVGTYRLTLVAKDASGLRSAPASVDYTLKAAKKTSKK